MWKRALGLFDWLARADFVRTIIQSIFGPSIWAKLLYGTLIVLGGGATAWQGIVHHISPVLWIPLAFVAAILGIALATISIIFVRFLTGASGARKAIDAVLEFSEGIEIILGSGPPFDHYRSHRHFRTHLIRVGVVSKRRLTNCELRVEKISGRLSQRCPVRVGAVFDLNPGTPNYIEFAAYDEAMKGPPIRESGSKRHTIEAKFPINQLSNSVSYLDDDDPYTLTLLASGAESAPCVIECRLWIDGDALKLERYAPELSDMLQLKEAAQIVYDETRHNSVSMMARGSDTSSPDPLDHIRNIVFRRVPIAFGLVRGATKLDPISAETKRDMIIYNGSADAGYVNVRRPEFSDVHVRKSDVQGCIDFIRRLDRPI